MAVFEYRAINAEGKKIRGVVDAESVRAARSKLKGKGIFPTDLKEKRAKQVATTKDIKTLFGDRKISPAQLGIATRQLATLVGAGMPLVESLKALGEQIDHPRLKTVFAEVCDLVNEGSTLANAMREYPKVFPELYSNMVSSAEASGTLEMVLERLADLLENQVALQRKVSAALAYPILMLLLCCGVVILLLAYVVPQLTAIFDEHGAALPLPTQIVITLSDFVQDFWLIILAALGAAAVGFSRYASSKDGRKRLDSMKLQMFFIGPVTTKVATARFSQTLGTMLTSGVELLSALSIVKNVIGNVILKEALESVADGVREGKGLAKELDRTKLFPRMIIHMIAIGERTGKLDSMLLRAAKNYESELDSLISGLTSILNPILILFLAGIVGFILISVMLPMLEMTSLVG